MRLQVVLDEAQLKALDEIAKRRRSTRSELVREAISDYLRGNLTTVRDEVFGIWRDEGIEGNDYQNSIRREWES